MKNLKIRSIIGLALIYAAVFLELQWIWGVLFLLWVLPDLFNGVTFFIEPVERKEHPLLYWAITVSWLWMSVYMIATPFIPALSGYPQAVKHTMHQVGVYEDAAPKVVKLDSQPVSASRQKETNLNKIAPAVSPPKDTLAYQLFEQKEVYTFVGILATVNEFDENLDRHIEELWTYFYENDISTAIPNIVDERMYMLYGKSDKEGTFEACLAYRTDGLEDIYEGLTGITVPAGKFAVFQKEGKEAEQFVAQTWEKIYTSDLDANQGYNLEVYTLDAAYDVQKAEIRVSIK